MHPKLIQYMEGSLPFAFAILADPHNPNLRDEFQRWHDQQELPAALGGDGVDCLPPGHVVCRGVVVKVHGPGQVG